MYEIKILYKDKSKKTIICEDNKLNKAEDSLIRLQGDIIKFYSVFKIE